MVLMPKFAPIVVLLFLGSIMAGMVAAATYVYAMARRQPAVKRWALIGILTIAAGYATLLFGASLTSREKVLTEGGKKYFCEIDCHLAYSIDRVRTAKALGELAHPARADGTFHVIALKTWFDENTISPMRPKEAPLYPNPRHVYIQDGSGRRYPPSEPGQRARQSYITQLVFDLPDDVLRPRLYVGDADPVSSFLIGHEESPLHRKIFFGLR